MCTGLLETWVIELISRATLFFPPIARMPSHTYKPNLSDLRNAAVLVESETRYTSRGPKERKILHMPSRSQSPRKKRQPSPSHQETPDMLNAEILHGYPEIGSEPLKLPKTKVRPIYWEKSFLTKSKTQNDYLREWHQDKSQQYLQRITRHQGYSGARACSSCNGCGSWKCLDCIGHLIYCIRCCREQHARHVFHRVEHWNGKFFKEVSLYQAGVALHFGHGGLPCPARDHSRHLHASGVGTEDGFQQSSRVGTEDGFQESSDEEGRYSSLFTMEQLGSSLTLNIPWAR